MHCSPPLFVNFTCLFIALVAHLRERRRTGAYQCPTIVSHTKEGKRGRERGGLGREKGQRRTKRYAEGLFLSVFFVSVSSFLVSLDSLSGVVVFKKKAEQLCSLSFSQRKMTASTHQRAGGVSGDVAAARRERRRQRMFQRERASFLLYAVRFALWLLVAYLIRHFYLAEAVKIYVIVSVLVFIACNLQRDDHAAGGGDVPPFPSSSSASPPRHASTSRASGVAASAAEGTVPDSLPQSLAQTSPTSAAFPRHLRTGGSPLSAGGKDGVSYATSSPTSTSARSAGVVTSLSTAQQQALLQSMTAIGTPGAMRCVMDARFRLTMAASGGVDPGEDCVCGSGQRFGRCCREVPQELARVLNTATA